MNAGELKKAVVAGAGTMGTSLARVFAAAGMDVTLWNRSEAGLERAGRSIEGNPEASGSGGRRNPKITMTTKEACFAEAEFVIENISENMEAKKEFYRRIGPMLPLTCIVTTNTSGLSVTELASVVEFPQRFCGMHWINPADIIPLVEVVSGDRTSEETARSVSDLAMRLGKKPIRTKDVPGFVLNRLQFAVLREALHIVECGAAGVEDVDNAMKYGLGLRYACLGPFETADLGGLDVFCGIADYLFADLDAGKETPDMLRRLKESGRLGLKSGKGFYDYSGDRAARVVDERNRKLLALKEALFRDGRELSNPPAENSLL